MAIQCPEGFSLSDARNVAYSTSLTTVSAGVDCVFAFIIHETYPSRLENIWKNGSTFSVISGRSKRAYSRRASYGGTELSW
jgi:hypothetical protein